MVTTKELDMYPNLRETTTPTPTGIASEEQLAEAKRLVEHGDKRLRDKEESFQRCDTDGFLSQWAAGITASEMHLKAAILRQGGTSIFRGLYYKSQRLKAKMVSVYNEYTFSDEMKWCCDLTDPLTDEITKSRKWIPTRRLGGNSRIQNQLGIYEADERDWAWVRVIGDRVNCRPVTIRVGDHDGGDSVFISRCYPDLEKRMFDTYEEACKIKRSGLIDKSTQEIEDELVAEIKAERQERNDQDLK